MLTAILSPEELRIFGRLASHFHEDWEFGGDSVQETVELATCWWPENQRQNEMPFLECALRKLLSTCVYPSSLQGAFRVK
mgnify:CR=1 FL=1